MNGRRLCYWQDEAPPLSASESLPSYPVGVEPVGPATVSEQKRLPCEDATSRRDMNNPDEATLHDAAKRSILGAMLAYLAFTVGGSDNATFAILGRLCSWPI